MFSIWVSGMRGCIHQPRMALQRGADQCVADGVLVGFGFETLRCVFFFTGFTVEELDEPDDDEVGMPPASAGREARTRSEATTTAILRMGTSVVFFGQPRRDQARLVPVCGAA